MRSVVTTAILSGMLLAVPAMTLAASQGSTPSKPPASQKAAPAKAATPATHATTGVVKSVDANSLVITKGKTDMTFALSSSTEKKGNVAVGANVQVHYTTAGKTNTATSVSV